MSAQLFLPPAIGARSGGHGAVSFLHGFVLASAEIGYRATEAGRLRLRSRRGSGLGGRHQIDHPRRRLHGRDARHRAGRARRPHPQRRPGTHHRLSGHRGRDRLDQPQRQPRRVGPRAGIRPGDRLRTGAGARRVSTCRRCRSATPRRRRLASAWSWRAPADGNAPWPRASSPSRSSPATGNTCSTRRSSRRPPTPTGAARR